MSDALERFFLQYYRRRPVNATFTGVHAFDELLPDWSPAGIDALDAEMRSLRGDLDVGRYEGADAVDAELAGAYLDIQLAENASQHGVRGNPSLWVGEAAFSIIGLITRGRTAEARIAAIPAFLETARATLSQPIPALWITKALHECEGAIKLGTDASPAFAAFARWLETAPVAPDSTMACGPALFDLLLHRGHQTRRSRADLLAEARHRFAEERARLHEMGWAEAEQALASDVPGAEEYLGEFQRVWDACRARVAMHDAVSWPDWPIRYTPIPEATRAAAPYLYYLFYRSPAPYDPYVIHDYVVPSAPVSRSVIKLNHVVHHGAVGHHVQNWHACHRAASRIGRVAAVDCASRIGMFCGGTMAEGWACYATGLMDELGFLTPLEQVSEQHTRVRFLGRAIVDIELHEGTMTFDGAVHFYAEQVGMHPDMARNEAVKNSMFPCTALMYWLGTQGILDLRASMPQKPLREFHDELLSHGSIPVPMIARLMTGGVS